MRVCAGETGGTGGRLDLISILIPFNFLSTMLCHHLVIMANLAGARLVQKVTPEENIMFLPNYSIKIILISLLFPFRNGSHFTHFSDCLTLSEASSVLGDNRCFFFFIFQLT